MSVWPQIVYLALLSISVGVSIARYGERKRGYYDLVDVVVAPALVFFVLWKGGFFVPLGINP